MVLEVSASVGSSDVLTSDLMLSKKCLMFLVTNLMFTGLFLFSTFSFMMKMSFYHQFLTPCIRLSF